jgi:5-methylcytosine-specific restriction endonuclease McrA
MQRSGFKPPTKEKLAELQAKKLERIKAKAKLPKPLKTAPVASGGTPTRKRKKTSPLAKLKKQLWQLCREITIKRDGSDCYTCPSKDLSGSSRHLGHFISSSICSTELRYDLKNLRIQCYSCNIHKSGNWLTYENRLKKENGENYVAELKQRNEQTKGAMYRDDFYINKIAEYQIILENL